MGGLLSIPTAIISAFSGKGITYCLHYIIPFFYLTFEEILRKKRFDLYDVHAREQPEKNGFFVAKEEKILDTPSKATCLKKNSDDVFIFGTNSKSESLAVSICRRPNQQVQCSLVLQLADGKLYVLPEAHATQTATSEDNTFGSARLKVQCAIPMRKWRIFFNGMLEEKGEVSDEPENSTNKYKHVRFSFIWTASSEVFDFPRDLSKTLLCDTIASSSLLKSPANIMKKLSNILDGYEQAGMILGTVKIGNDPENELYLWGIRRRFMGKNMLFRKGHCTNIYGNFRNGVQLHLSFTNSCKIFKRLQYGYIMKSTGFMFPIDKIIGDIDNITTEAINVKCRADNQWYRVKIIPTGTIVSFQNEYGENSICTAADILMNDKPGKGFLLRGNETKYGGFPTKQNAYTMSNLNSLLSGKKNTSMFCIQLKEELCQKSELCGGKGSSLGNLYTMRQMTNNGCPSKSFSVPNGLVVSTEAYKKFTRGKLADPLQNFEKQICRLHTVDIQSSCQKMVEMVSMAELPKSVEQSIIDGLQEAFGASVSEHKFAVRSSATGEDTEQMSAAGQMETFLGLKSIDEILRAVKRCWASQFSFQAVEYKRGYGQPLNTPMAVVIQEMVSCEKAGVIFTCDPVSGDPSFISITANWGLGESVVSASADPDTTMLRRTLSNKLSIHSTQIGQKKTKIIMDGESGTKEIRVDDNESSVHCISETMALRLGKIAVETEKFYGTPRDIEWGIVGEEVYLFQSRPVTSLDIETDFETKHFFDNFQRTEKSFLTKANVGEVMPGATSPLGIDVTNKVLGIGLDRRLFPFDEGSVPQKPYYQRSCVTAFNQFFSLLIGGFMNFDKDNEEVTKSLLISIFGRFIDDKEIRAEAEDRDCMPRMTLLKKIGLIIYMLWISFFSGFIIRFRTKKIKKSHIPYDNKNSAEILQSIGDGIDVSYETMTMHMNCSVSSSVWNLSLLQLLAKAKGDWDQDVFADFAYLLSICNAVESANIPASIQDLGAKIRENIDPAKFREMADEDVINWLNSDLSEAGTKYRQFMERHGHRCLKEIDVYVETWASDPKPVIKMLKNFVNENTMMVTAKLSDSFQTILSKLRVKLKFTERCFLRFYLPQTRRGVQEREYAKSLAVSNVDKIRKALRKLSEVMVEEGRLPRKELLFFLCIDEISQLIRTRSPRLITKAMRRFKVHEELNKLLFPEICIGIPKPMNYKDDIISGKGFKMTGVPVSQGVTKATARVVMELKDATSIQQGDVLIAYSTDVGWTPYFPLLSGIVTELGGLISHGAVVAREYGLPCVVSLHGATRAFKSGDIVILDGNNGTLQRVDEE